MSLAGGKPFGTPSFKDASYGARGSSSFNWPLLHQGGRQSTSSAQLLFRYRTYSGGLGLWLQEDPIGYLVLEPNLSGGYLNNPAFTVDPLGLYGDKAGDPKPGCTSGTVHCGPGYMLPKPGNSFVVCSSHAPYDDFFGHVWAGTGRIRCGVHSWDEIANCIEWFYPDDRLTCLVLSGHGNDGGVGTTIGKPMSGPTLGEDIAKRIRCKLKPGGAVIIAACNQGSAAHLESLQELADKLGVCVFANTGCVSWGTWGAGEWIVVKPSEKCDQGQRSGIAPPRR